MADEDTTLTDVFPEVPESANGSGESPPEPTVYDQATPDEGTDEVRPSKSAGPRSSAAGLLSLIWGGFGVFLTQKQIDIPVGRVLSLQAPLAGAKLDAALAGTIIDKALQPFVKAGEAAEGFGSLIAFPILVAITEREPALYPTLYPVLREVVETSLGDLAPELRKQRGKNARNLKAVADLASDFNLTVEKGQDPVDVFMSYIFSVPPTPQEVDDEQVQ